MTNEGKNEPGIYWPMVIVVAGTAIFALVFGYVKYSEHQTTDGINNVNIRTSAPVVQKVSDKTNDGSVIVRDRGASFKMAPVSKDQPKVISEQEVRVMQNK